MSLVSNQPNLCCYWSFLTSSTSLYRHRQHNSTTKAKRLTLHRHSVSHRLPPPLIRDMPLSISGMTKYSGWSITRGRLAAPCIGDEWQCSLLNRSGGKRKPSALLSLTSMNARATNQTRSELENPNRRMQWPCRTAHDALQTTKTSSTRRLRRRQSGTKGIATSWQTIEWCVSTSLRP